VAQHCQTHCKPNDANPATPSVFPGEARGDQVPRCEAHPISEPSTRYRPSGVNVLHGSSLLLCTLHERKLPLLPGTAALLAAPAGAKAAITPDGQLP